MKFIAKRYLESIKREDAPYLLRLVEKYIESAEENKILCVILSGIRNWTSGEECVCTHAYKISFEELEKIGEWVSRKVTERRAYQCMEMRKVQLLTQHGLDDISIARKNGLI